MDERNFPPQPPAPPSFPMGRKELLFAGAMLLFSLICCNCLLYAGANLGFSLGLTGILTATFFYLRSHGHRPGRYEYTLLGLSLGIICSFARSSDGLLKFFSFLVLLVVPPLAFCLMAGQNRRDPGGISSLLDGFRALFSLGIGGIGASCRGVREGFQSGSAAGKKSGSVLLGLVLAIPLAAVLIPLLMRADAAFEGLLDKLPQPDWAELVYTVLFGVSMACVYYSRAAALHCRPKPEPATPKGRGMNAVTVNTVLLTAVFVYGVYLLSQAAYFAGGFSGILPEDYTLAQYARRGFFEMAWLCAINLTVIALSVGLVCAQGKLPALTRSLCLILGAVTLFLVAAASAKMFLYIGSYGLTRLRVLTQVFMLWLAAATVFVCVWLFRPKTPYLKWSLVLGLSLFALLLWTDVDTQVARYNVRAYQSGRLESVDVTHLYQLGHGAVPYLEELTHDADSVTAQRAANCLRNAYLKSASDSETDIRGWNYAEARALSILEEYRAGSEAAERTESP